MNRILQTPALSVVSLALLLLVSLGLGQTASAQRLISTKAGLVNRVEGKVYIQRQGSEAAERGRASLGTQMKDGDLLVTAAESHAEVLLSPGSYLRLDEQTEVRALNTVISEMRFEIVKGSAIIEVSDLDKKMPLEVLTPQGPVAIAKVGLYRFDVKGPASVISVQKGELFLGTREELLAKRATKLGRGKFARLSGAAGPEIAKLEKYSSDAFDEWSFQRAEMLVAANYSVLQRARSSRALAFGWTYDPFYNCYTYIPGSWQITSPYGFGFYRRLSDCACYFPYNYPSYGSGTYQGGGGTTAGGGSGVKPSPPARATPNAGSDGARAPIHREIPPGRRVDPDSPRPIGRPDFGGHSGSGRSGDMGGGGARGHSGGGGIERSSGGAVERGGGAQRSEGAASPRSPRNPQ